MTNCFFTRHCVHFCTTCSFRNLQNFSPFKLCRPFHIIAWKSFFLVFGSFEIHDAIISWISGYFWFWFNCIFCRKIPWIILTWTPIESRESTSNSQKHIEHLKGFHGNFLFQSLASSCMLEKAWSPSLKPPGRKRFLFACLLTITRGPQFLIDM